MLNRVTIILFLKSSKAVCTLSLHDALPIFAYLGAQIRAGAQAVQLFDSWVGQLAPEDFRHFAAPWVARIIATLRSEEHTSELQSHVKLVCRLLPEKKKTDPITGFDRKVINT